MKKIIIFIKSLFKKAGNCFFVGATDILPEPLSKEKEDYYLELLEDGDSKAKDILIEHNLRLVVFLAKKTTNLKLCSINISLAFSSPSSNNSK